MRLWLIFLVFVVGLPGGGGQLREAYRLYETGQFDKSVEAYLLSLRDNVELTDEIRFNAGQAYMRMDSLTRALRLFEQLDRSPDLLLAASASNNAGIILVRMGRYAEARESFRRALIFDPSHEVARYNFELLSKRMEQQPPPPPEEPSPPTQAPPQVPMDISDAAMQQILQGLQERRSGVSEDLGTPTLPGDTLNAETALRVLNQLRQQEIQYVQQLRRIYGQSNRDRRNRGW